MNKERRIGLGLLATGVIGVLIVIAIVAIARGGALQYTIVFDDAKGLQAGDKVQINGVDVGTVKSVKLVNNERVDVVVKIDPDHAAKVRADSSAFISNVSLPNVSGQKVVEILNPPGPPAPQMKHQSEIKGVDSIIDLQMWKIKHKLGDAADKLSDKISSTAQSIKENTGPARQKLRESGEQLAAAVREKSVEWSAKLKDVGGQIEKGVSDPKVRELFREIKAKLDEFIRLMREKGAAAIDELQQRWQTLKPQIESMLGQLKQLGQKYVVETFRQVMSEIEQVLDRFRDESKQPEAEPSPTQ